MILEFNNLTLGYNRHPVVHHLQHQLRRGSFTALVGGNGAGKSTLLKAIMAELKPLQGELINRAQSSAYMPQQSNLDREFPLLVEHAAAAGLWSQTGFGAPLNSRLRAKIGAALSQVNIADLARRSLSELSGGQFQRLLFARLLLQDAELLLLDEPFNGVDANTVADMLTLLHSLNSRGATIVLVLHDLQIVREHIPECMLLATQLLASGPSREVLSAENLAKASASVSYTATERVCEF